MCHALEERLFCLPNVQVLAFVVTLDCRHYVVLFVSRCFVLSVDKLLPQGIGGIEVHHDVAFVEDPPDLHRKPCNIWNDNVVPFSADSTLSPLGFLEGLD